MARKVWFDSLKCPYCGSKAVLRDSTFVHPNARKTGDKVWVCSEYPRCDSYVGCHSKTTIPLGRLANKELRELRKRAHQSFDPIWQSGLVSRKEAYAWLCDMLGLTYNSCHLALFGEDQCKKVIELCEKQTNELILDYKHKHGIKPRKLAKHKRRRKR